VMSPMAEAGLYRFSEPHPVSVTTYAMIGRFDFPLLLLLLLLLFWFKILFCRGEVKLLDAGDDNDESSSMR